MKNTLYMLLAIVLLVSSCAENPSSNDGEPEEQTKRVVILLSTGSRSGDEVPPDVDPEDDEITSLRLLAYSAKTGILYKNYVLELPKDRDPQPIEILTGLYNLVFIANATSDPATEAALGALIDGESTFSSLGAMSFPRTAFAADKPIPMVALCRNVRIVGDEQYVDPTVSEQIQEGEWTIQLERLGVRFDAQIEFRNAEQVAESWTMELLNVPDRAYVLPAEGTARNRAVVRGIVYPGVGMSDGLIRSWNRIIVPENVFDPETDADKATRIGVRFGSVLYSAALGFKLETKNYNLPRNTWIGIEAEFSDAIVLGPLNVNQWNRSNNVPIPF